MFVFVFSLSRAEKFFGLVQCNPLNALGMGFRHKSYTGKNMNVQGSLVPIEAAITKIPWRKRETNAREKDEHIWAEVIAG